MTTLTEDQTKGIARYCVTTLQDWGATGEDVKLLLGGSKMQRVVRLREKLALQLAAYVYVGKGDNWGAVRIRNAGQVLPAEGGLMGHLKHMQMGRFLGVSGWAVRLILKRNGWKA